MKGYINLKRADGNNIILSVFEVMILLFVIVSVYMQGMQDIAMFGSMLLILTLTISKPRSIVEKEIPCELTYDGYFSTMCLLGTIKYKTDLLYCGYFDEDSNKLYLYSKQNNRGYLGYDAFIIILDDAREFTETLKRTDSTFLKLLNG